MADTHQDLAAHFGIASKLLVLDYVFLVRGPKTNYNGPIEIADTILLNLKLTGREEGRFLDHASCTIR